MEENFNARLTNVDNEMQLDKYIIIKLKRCDELSIVDNEKQLDKHMINKSENCNELDFISNEKLLYKHIIVKDESCDQLANDNEWPSVPRIFIKEEPCDSLSDQDKVEQSDHHEIIKQEECHQETIKFEKVHGKAENICSITTQVCKNISKHNDDMLVGSETLLNTEKNSNFNDI